MDNKKLIFTSLIVLALVVAALSITYALNVGVTQNDTSDYDLSYTFDISDNATWTINIEAGKTKIYDIAVTNPYNDSIKYGIVYKLNNPTTMPDNSLVGILSDSENPSEGIIEANSSKNISVAIVNGSTSNMQVTLAIVNGYKNGGELIIPEGYTLITEEYEIGVSPAKQTLKKLGLSETSGTPDFSKTSCSSGCGESTVGIYKAKDDFGDSYYFRGDVENNYVYFAGFYWRIIRINGDGSVRMIYAGTSAHENGYDDSNTNDMRIGKSAFYSLYNDNAYVGYMYGTIGASTYDEAHANTNDSTIKTYLDNWYNTNIKGTTNEQYIADTIYCNDRELDSGTGAGTTVSYYKAYNRLEANKTPTLKCTQANDRFTVNPKVSGIMGNGALTNPIGLITADEVSYAGGGLRGTNNSKYYLYSANWFWTMSPYTFDGSYAYEFSVSSMGFLFNNTVYSNSLDVRPVISISPDNLEGSGTMSDPFKISNENQTLTSKQVLTKLGLTENTGTPNFAKTSCSSGCNETTVGVFKTQDDFGDSYYFRGDVENNYVLFADKYWRIIRINGDGSVRMIYAGTSAHSNGYDDSSANDTSIGDNTFNSSNNDNAYVGYMYGATGASTYDATHSNINDSTIKVVLDGWYNTNIKGTANEQYVVDTIYCNDREVSSGTGIGTTDTDYKLKARIEVNNNITLKCSQVNDRFTVNSKVSGITGNGALTNPIGLITADEVTYAGGSFDLNNSKYYLYNKNFFWTMSPVELFDGSSYGFIVNSRGGLVDSPMFRDGYVDSYIGVRPVISISGSALNSGTGSMNDPFKIS